MTAQTSAHASTEPPSSFEVSGQSNHPENSVRPYHARGGSEDGHGYPQTLKRPQTTNTATRVGPSPEKLEQLSPQTFHPGKRSTPMNHPVNSWPRDVTRSPRPGTPKTVSDHTMLAQLDLVEINRIELCGSGLEVVRSRGQENTSGRPGRKRLRRTSEQERRSMEHDTGRHRQSRSGKHVRPPPSKYFTRIDELRKEDVGPEEGRANPQEARIRRRRSSA